MKMRDVSTIVLACGAPLIYNQYYNILVTATAQKDNSQSECKIYSIAKNSLGQALVGSRVIN